MGHNFVIAGHSYVRRLKYFKPQFNVGTTNVLFYHKNGGRVIDLAQSSTIRELLSTTPSAVFLQIRGNDITGSNQDDHKAIPTSIYELANKLVVW